MQLLMYVLCKDGLINTLFTTQNGMETIQFRSTYFGQFLCPSSGDFPLYTQQWYMSYRFADSLQACKLSANLYDIYHCCVYSGKSPDDGQRNCPKYVDLNWIVSIPFCVVNNVLIKPSLHNTYINSCIYYNYSTKLSWIVVINATVIGCVV